MELISFYSTLSPLFLPRKIPGKFQLVESKRGANKIQARGSLFRGQDNSLVNDDLILLNVRQNLPLGAIQHLPSESHFTILRFFSTRIPYYWVSLHKRNVRARPKCCHSDCRIELLQFHPQKQMHTLSSAHQIHINSEASLSANVLCKSRYYVDIPGWRLLRITVVDGISEAQVPGYQPRYQVLLHHSQFAFYSLFPHL